MDSFIVSGHLMQRAALIFCWVLVIATGAFLRFDDLSSRSFHADEATGARITANRMESKGGTFDPKHYHGPLLGDLAAPLCRARGESGWRDMRKSTLRTVPALAGVFLLATPLLWRRRCGDGAALLAAALLATSPLLVYYSRMFIHEMLLVWFGMLTLAVLTHKPVAGLTGLLMGLMFATKESFAISILAWTGAGLLLAFENRVLLDKRTLLDGWRQYRKAVMISLVVAAAVSGIIYTHGLRHPQGAVDAIRTFFVYETVEGHDKPFAYYINLLLMPVKSGGVWWFGTPVVVLALAAYISTFRKDAVGRKTIRFTAYAAVGHLLIYSLFGYKTPWLACLPWAHVCLLAGFAVADFAKRSNGMKTALAGLIVITLFSQFQQTRRAIGRYASDDRNPFAYVPTRRDAEALEIWLERMRGTIPPETLEPVAVVGVDYWPLPWYLRSFERIGYWKTASDEIAGLPLVFTMPETTADVMELLGETHVPVPRGLRAGVPVHLFVRKDIWKQWMEGSSR